MTQSDWVSNQITSRYNTFSVLSILCFMLYLLFFDYNTTAIIIFFVLFFLATAWEMLATMIFFSIIIAGILAVLPFLAPVAFVLMVILFIARIDFVIKNWRAVVGGFAVYGLAYD